MIAFAITADSAWPLPRHCHTGGGGVNWQIDAHARLSSNNLETHFYPSFFSFRFRNFSVPRFGRKGGGTSGARFIYSRARGVGALDGIPRVLGEGEAAGRAAERMSKGCFLSG